MPHRKREREEEIVEKILQRDGEKIERLKFLNESLRVG